MCFTVLPQALDKEEAGLRSGFFCEVFSDNEVRMKVEIKVFPGASREEIVEKDGKIKVYVNPSPDRGKANSRVIELVAEKFGVRKKDVSIFRGETSRNKILEVNVG
jgi:uncharacterized protein